MEWLSDFAGYMFFSSLEYFAVFFIIFSLFNLYPSYYKKELFILTTCTTFVSYLLTIFEVYNYIPTPIITVPVVTIMIKLAVRKKWFYSFVITTIGFMLASLIQLTIAWLFLHYDFITVDNLSDSFTDKTYFIQTVNSVVSDVVAITILLTRGGFGFSFRKETNSTFVFISLILLMMFALVIYAFTTLETTVPMYFILIGTVLSSSLILFYLSHKQEDREYR